MRNKLLSYIRKNIGNYCVDAYWYNVIDICYTSGHAVKYLREHLSYFAINAIGTDNVTKYG